ncbi:hypothetical protein IWQ60_008616 [Tieghemiomyces parasiticus]|uniref:Elongation of fatty acids protein n=1 Tax=Tieghemiomyces parasiticus TaxID=78921 RepID=A0A9W7ZXV8_9FUNG|nr:hypothetical protein IWQ60_008616 [Tieghemiomyces parasiticus]
MLPGPVASALDTMLQSFTRAPPPLPIPVTDLPFASLYPWVMHWKFPIFFALTYALIVKYINSQRPVGILSRVQAKDVAAASGGPGADKAALKAKAAAAARAAAPAWTQTRAFTAFVFLHNLVLCVYSGITFYKVVATLIPLLKTQSLHTALCDSNDRFWANGLYYWGYLFYLSKFYEVIDTIIILLKGRRSSTLQTYHHSGAILCMWSGIQFRSIPIWMFVVFNSLVHTVMYFYYMCTSVGVHPPGKKYITTMQITQFFVGLILANAYLFVPSCLVNEGQRFAVYLNTVYLFPLIYLFVQFAINTYFRTPNKVKKA